MFVVMCVEAVASPHHSLHGQVMEHPEAVGTNVIPVQFNVRSEGRNRSGVLISASGRRVVEEADDHDAYHDLGASSAVGYPAPVPSAADFPALPSAEVTPRSVALGSSARRGSRRGRPRPRSQDFPSLSQANPHAARPRARYARMDLGCVSPFVHFASLQQQMEQDKAPREHEKWTRKNKAASLCVQVSTTVGMCSVRWNVLTFVSGPPNAPLFGAM